MDLIYLNTFNLLSPIFLLLFCILLLRNDVQKWLFQKLSALWRHFCWVGCFLKQLLNSVEVNIPYMVWCSSDTSLKRSRLQSHLSVFRLVTKISDAKASIMSFRKICVNWITAPRKPVRKTSFITRTDIITREGTKQEV